MNASRVSNITIDRIFQNYWHFEKIISVITIWHCGLVHKLLQFSLPQAFMFLIDFFKSGLFLSFLDLWEMYLKRGTWMCSVSVSWGAGVRTIRHTSSVKLRPSCFVSLGMWHESQAQWFISFSLQTEAITWTAVLFVALP